MLKAVIFDLDDTLYNYSDINREAIEILKQYVCKKFKISEKTFSEILFRARKDTKEGMCECASQHNRIIYFQKMMEYLNVKPVLHALELYDMYWNYMLEHMQLEDGVLQLFEKLKEKKIKISICTDLTTHIQHRKIKQLGIDQYVDCLVTSEEAGEEKPSKKMFSLCLKKLNMEPSEACFIGDSMHKDIVGANKVGMKAIWIKKKDIEERIVECITIKSFSELLNEGVLL